MVCSLSGLPESCHERNHPANVCPGFVCWGFLNRFGLLGVRSAVLFVWLFVWLFRSVCWFRVLGSKKPGSVCLNHGPSWSWLSGWLKVCWANRPPVRVRHNPGLSCSNPGRFNVRLSVRGVCSYWVWEGPGLGRGSGVRPGSGVQVCPVWVKVHPWLITSVWLVARCFQLNPEPAEPEFR